MSLAPRHVVIVGVGISGLTAAFRLRQRDALVRITLLEASDRLGGVIQTTHAHGCLLEHGPDSIVTAKPAGVALLTDLGLAEHMIGVEPNARRSLIARGQKLIPVPDGLYLLAPGRFGPFVRSPLISWRGKIRMGVDLLLPRRAAHLPEESLAQFVRRRLGREALTRLAQPMIGGIYTADPERLSVAATMPQFLIMEREHRSLLLAMRARAREIADANGPRYGLFATLKGGMQTLTDTLSARCRDGGSDLRLRTKVSGVARASDGFTLSLPAGESLHADALILALPAHATSTLTRALDPQLSAELAAIPYAGVATVNLAFARAAIPALPIAAGFVIPAIDGRATIAATIVTAKYAGRAPDDTVLIRAFVGGAMGEQRLAQNDEHMIAAVRNDLRDLLNIHIAPTFTAVHRWPQAMAQYVLGHQAHVERIRARTAAIPGLYLLGNGYAGVGIPDLAEQANAVAQEIGEWISAP